MNDNRPSSQSFHQGFNAAAFFGLCFLAYYEAISGVTLVVLMLILIGFYVYRYK